MVAPTHPTIDVRPAGKREHKLTSTERFAQPAPPVVKPVARASTETPAVRESGWLSGVVMIALVIAFFAFIIWLAAQGTPSHYDPTYDYWMY